MVERISWYRGSSLSPDGTKLMIHSGTELMAWHLLDDGSYRSMELRLPAVTYGAGPQGFYYGVVVGG